MENKKIAVVIIATVIIVAMLLFYYKRYLMPKHYTIDDAKAGLKAVADKYGNAMAATVEKMYRNETANFTSKQYVLTGTPGMEAGKWGQFRFGYAIGAYATVPLNDNQVGDQRKFIVFPSVTDAMLFVAAYINYYNGNYARWNSTDPTIQAQYRARVEGLTASITNNLSNNLA